MDLLGGTGSLSFAVSLAASAAAPGRRVGLVDGARMDGLLSAKLRQEPRHFFTDWAEDRGQTFAADSNRLPVGSREGILHWLGPPMPPVVNDLVEQAAFAHLAAAAREELDALFFLVGPSWRAGGVTASTAADRVLLLTRRDSHGARLMLDAHSWAPESLGWAGEGGAVPEVLVLPGDSGAEPLKEREMAALLREGGCLWPLKPVAPVTGRVAGGRVLLPGKRGRALAGVLGETLQEPAQGARAPVALPPDPTVTAWPEEGSQGRPGPRRAPLFRLPWTRRQPGPPAVGGTVPGEPGAREDVPLTIPEAPLASPPERERVGLSPTPPAAEPDSAGLESNPPEPPDWSGLLGDWPPVVSTTGPPKQSVPEPPAPSLMEHGRPDPMKWSADIGAIGPGPEDQAGTPVKTEVAMETRRSAPPKDRSRGLETVPPCPPPVPEAESTIQTRRQAEMPPSSNNSGSSGNDDPWAALLRLVDRPSVPASTNEKG